MIRAIRYHDFSVGHRVYGHESKCANLHGHNYRITFEVDGELDAVGRVLDFAVIKTVLCQWLEDEWDHRFLVYMADPLALTLKEIDETVVIVPFNPTAENIAIHLVDVVGPSMLPAGYRLIKCTVEETRKCAASYEQ